MEYINTTMDKTNSKYVAKHLVAPTITTTNQPIRNQILRMILREADKQRRVLID